MSLFPLVSPAAAVPPSITYISRGEITSTLSTFTFSSQDLGANSGRILIGVGAEFAGTVNSVTANGQSATQVVTTSSGGAAPIHSEIWQVDPLGASGDVVVTLSATSPACGIAIARIVSVAASATDTGGDIDSATMSDTINIPAGGVCFGYGMENSNTTPTWGGITKSFDATWGGRDHTAALDLFATQQTGLSITLDNYWSRCSFSIASFGPA